MIFLDLFFANKIVRNLASSNLKKKNSRFLTQNDYDLIFFFLARAFYFSRHELLSTTFISLSREWQLCICVI